MSEDDDKRESVPDDGPDVSQARNTPPETEVPDLVQTLLRSEIADDDKPGNRAAYPLWGMAIATLAIAFHLSILLVHNLPGKGLAAGVHKWFDKHLDARQYMRAAGSNQSWAMFAPNPHRSNIFMRVEVVKQDGAVVDLEHDIYGRRWYPYLWYDRRGKINRRIIDGKGYRRHYAAWVCRQWEREHGVLPDEIRFTKLWTQIPSPATLLKQTRQQPWRGYDPMKLHLNEREEDGIRCNSTRHAQLPNYLRARYGMEPESDNHFRGLYIRTWVDAAEDEDDRSPRAKRKAKSK